MIKELSLENLRSCIEIPDERILVVGNRLMNVYSLKTYQKVNHIQSDDINFDLLITPDKKMIFISTTKGLKQYSLPGIILYKVHLPSSHSYCLHMLKNKNRILFNDKNKLFSLDLNTSEVTKFQDQHSHFIYNIASTSDEKLFFTAGQEKVLKKWSSDTWNVMRSINIASDGRSLFVNQDSKSILVGMENGTISEFSIDFLSVIKTFSLFNTRIRKILRLSSGDTMACSDDGLIKFPFSKRSQIKVSESSIKSITQLSDLNIVCCCDDGLKVIDSVEDLSTLRIDSISSSLESIRRSSSPREPQLISLFQHHLSQLITQVQPQPKQFTGLSLSLLPDLKWIQRSHFFHENSVGRKKIFTQNYFLEMINSKSILHNSEASLTLFNRKLKLLGTLRNHSDPITDFKVKKVRKSKWIFTIEQDILFDKHHLFGLATVHFNNGYLKCYINEGDVLTQKDTQSILSINGVDREVIAIGTKGIIVTSDLNIFSLNLDTNHIEHINSD